MLDQLRVEPGTAANLDGRDPGDTLGMSDKSEGKQRRDDLADAMAELQSLLRAEKKRALLLVLQGMDGSGKDSTARRGLRAGKPRGRRAAAFGRPPARELAPDSL